MAPNPVFKTFCRCASLRTGSLVAAVAGIVLALIGIVLVLVADVDFRTIVMDWLPTSVVKIIMIVSFAMTVPITIAFIIGVCKRNMYLMMPWVLLGLMLGFGILVSVVYTAIQFFLNDQPVNGTYWIVVGLLSFVVYMYMWLVAYSHFCVIKAEHDRGAYVKDPFRRRY